MNLNGIALVIIDVQKAFDHPQWGLRNNIGAEKNIQRLLAYWRGKGGTVLFVQHGSDDVNSLFYEGASTFQMKELVKPLPSEPRIVKRVNSAFIGTDLEERLRKENIHTVVLTGLTTPHCVSTTARMSHNLGFQTYVVADATAAYELSRWDGVVYDPTIVHELSLATLHEEFATIIETDQCLKNGLHAF